MFNNYRRIGGGKALNVNEFFSAALKRLGFKLMQPQKLNTNLPLKKAFPSTTVLVIRATQLRQEKQPLFDPLEKQVRLFIRLGNLIQLGLYQSTQHTYSRSKAKKNSPKEFAKKF